MNDSLTPKLEGAVSVVLSSDDLKSLVAEYTELGVDAFIEQGVARDIPLINTIVAVARVGATIRDRLFTKKLLTFLGPWAEVPPDERKAMVVKLESDTGYGRKVGEHLIELLDRIESHKKPRMLACVFLAYNSGKIDADMLHRLVHVVDKLPAFEISALRRFCDSPAKRKAPNATLANLSAVGLLKFTIQATGTAYKPTDIASQFLALELDRLE